MTTTTELATDPTTLAIQQVADIVSRTAAWQESTAKHSAEEALEFIKKSFLNPPDQQIDHPWAVVFDLAGTTWEKWTDTVSMPSGSLSLRLLMPEETRETELEERRFNNWHGAIAQALGQYAGAGYLLTPTITNPPAHTSLADAPAQHPYWDVEYTIAWSCK